MRTPRKVPRSTSERVIAYMRTSTTDQMTDQQRTHLEREATYRGWADVEWIEDHGQSAKSLKRPGMTRALEMLACSQAGTLVASKLDRLSRSVADFAELMTLAEQQGWALIALDVGVDMTTPTGRFIAGVMSQVSQLERELIGERTRAAMAEKRRQGVRLGKPRIVSDATMEWAVILRKRGATLQEIADDLNRREMQTARGGCWWPSTVAGLLRSHELDEQAARARAS